MITKILWLVATLLLAHVEAQQPNKLRPIGLLIPGALHHVDKILKGANAGELPIEQPTRFEFAVNLNAAKQIGLTIPPHVLARADRVIR